VVELLIAYGADVNHTLPDGYTTPLYVATLEGHTEVMDLLLGAGAIVSVDEDELLEYPEEQVQVQVQQPKKGALKKATSARSFGKVPYYRTREASSPHTSTSHTHTPHTRGTTRD
jgi:ankyrin repeat protein